jgi:hypothetical protein
MAYSQAKLKAMTIQQILVPKQNEQERYQMLLYTDTATGFNVGHFYERQQFHWYKRLTENYHTSYLVIKLYNF